MTTPEQCLLCAGLVFNFDMWTLYEDQKHLDAAVSYLKQYRAAGGLEYTNIERCIVNTIASQVALTINVGDQVHWTDPDEGLCSGSGVVTEISGDRVWVRKDGGGEVECPFSELEKLPEQPCP